MGAPLVCVNRHNCSLDLILMCPRPVVPLYLGFWFEVILLQEVEGLQELVNDKSPIINGTIPTPRVFSNLNIISAVVLVITRRTDTSLVSKRFKKTTNIVIIIRVIPVLNMFRILLSQEVFRGNFVEDDEKHSWVGSHLWMEVREQHFSNFNYTVTQEDNK